MRVTHICYIIVIYLSRAFENLLGTLMFLLFRQTVLVHHPGVDGEHCARHYARLLGRRDAVLVLEPLLSQLGFGVLGVFLVEIVDETLPTTRVPIDALEQEVHCLFCEFDLLAFALLLFAVNF